MNDAEVLHLVKHKHIAPYQLEGALNDPLRGVHIRRILFEQAMLPKFVEGLKSIPFQPFDYELVIDLRKTVFLSFSCNLTNSDWNCFVPFLFRQPGHRRMLRKRGRLRRSSNRTGWPVVNRRRVNSRAHGHDRRLLSRFYQPWCQSYKSCKHNDSS